MIISGLGNAFQASIWDSLAISLESCAENLRNSTILELVVDQALAGNVTHVIAVKRQWFTV